MLDSSIHHALASHLTAGMESLLASCLIQTQVWDQQALSMYLLPHPPLSATITPSIHHSQCTWGWSVWGSRQTRYVYQKETTTPSHTHTQKLLSQRLPPSQLSTPKSQDGGWEWRMDGTFYPVTHTQRNQCLSSTIPNKTMSRSQIYCTTLTRPLPFLNFAVGL